MATIPSLYGQRAGLNPPDDMIRRLFAPRAGQTSPYAAPAPMPAPTPPPSYAAANPYAAAPAPAARPTAGYQPQGGGPTGYPQVQPPPSAAGVNPFMAALTKPQVDPFADLDTDHRRQLDEYFNSLAGIDYKGSHESALLQRAALAQLMRQWEAEGPIDYTSAAPIADQFGENRDRLQARLAALGQQGGTVAGAIGQSYDAQSRGVGDFLRSLIEQRNQQHHMDLQEFNRWVRGLNAMGLQQNIAEQNDPGFWGDLLGVVGSGVGAFAGGLGGGLGKKIGGG